MSTFEGRTSFTEAFRMLGLKKMATFREPGAQDRRRFLMAYLLDADDLDGGEVVVGVVTQILQVNHGTRTQWRGAPRDPFGYFDESGCLGIFVGYQQGE